MAQATAERARRNAPPPPTAPPETSDAQATPANPPTNEPNGAPRPPNGAQTPKTPEEADPFLFMRQFSSDDWRLLTAYLYRTAPITNKRGTETNIQMYVAPFDQDDIMKKHGSGGYRVDLNQDRPEGGGRRRLRQFYFEILNPDYPPVVPPGEWVDDPRNHKWAWAKDAPAGGPSMSGSPERIVKMVLDAVEKARPNVSKEDQTNLANKIVGMVESQQKQLMELADPTKGLDKIKNLIDAFMPKGRGNDDPLYLMLLEDRKAARDEAKAEREANAKLLDKLLNRPEPKGFLEQLIENEPALSKVQAIFGGGRQQSSRTDWGEVALQFGTKLVEGLAPIGVAIITRGQQPQQQQQPGARPWPPQAPTQQQPAAPRQVSAPPPAAQQPAAPAAQATVETTATEIDPPEGSPLSPAELAELMQRLPKYGAVIQQAIPFMVDQFRAGLSGYEFRDWFISRHGLNWWKAMQKDLKPRGLLMAAKYDPELWAALQPEEKAAEFFAQFFTEPEDEPLPASEFDPNENENENGEPED